MRAAAEPGLGQIDHTPTPDELAYVSRTAEPILGDSTAWLAARVAESSIHVVYRITESAGGLLYNASVLLGPDGILGFHRKHKLWDAATGGNEHLTWAAGSTPGVVVPGPLGRIGLLTCIEMGYGLGPGLASQGADLIATALAWPAFAGTMYDDAVRATARESAVWHVVANQVGTVGHAADYGHSSIVDPSGNVVADTVTEEGMVVSELDQPRD